MSLCPEGNYTAEVLDQALGKTRTGAPQFILRFKIGGTEPIERNLYLFLTDAAMSYTKEHLRRLGYQGDTLGPLDPNSAHPHSFAGQSIEVYCKHELYEGKTQEKWALSRNQGIHAEPLPASALPALDRLFRAASEPKRETTPPPAPVANDGTEITDEDFPF